MKLKHIRDRYAGLVGLSRRVLPSPSTEAKVHFLLVDRFKEGFEASEKARKKVIADRPALDEDAVPASVLEARQIAMDTAMEIDYPIRKIPDHMRIKAADMPKALKGENGWQNAQGNTEIKMLLGPLYVREGDELLKEQPDGFEADGPSEPAPVDAMAEHVADGAAE